MDGVPFSIRILNLSLYGGMDGGLGAHPLCVLGDNLLRFHIQGLSVTDEKQFA